MIVASTRRNVSPIYVRTERTRFWEFLSGWHLGSNFFTLKICPDRRKVAPNLPNISKFGLRWVALHGIEAAKPSQPLPLPIHHQYVTWWDPMWPRTCVSVRIGHLGAPSKPHGFVRMASGKRQFFPPKVSGWASGFFTYIRGSYSQTLTRCASA